MGCPACLITAAPEFEDSEQSRPILLAETASPDPRAVIDFDIAVSQSQVVEAQLAPSNDKGQPIEVQLYVDYGQPLGKLIAQRVFAGADVPPYDVGQPVRIAQAEIFSPLALGCHSLTLIVAHEFDNPSQCPKRLDDSSQLTWQLLVRDDEQCGDEGCACVPRDPADLESLVSCPDVANNFDPTKPEGQSP